MNRTSITADAGPSDRAEETDAAATPRRWPRRLAVAVLVLLVAAVALTLLASRIDARGVAFHATGEDAVATLDRLAAALAAGDTAAASAALASDYAAPPHALGHRVLVEEKDGIRRYRLGDAAAATGTLTTTATLDRDAAVAEWSAYLAGFASIDELRLHLDRVDDWQTGGPLTGVVRFEAIGTPQGAPRAGVDRARLSARFVPAPGGEGLLLATASLVDGERLIAERPHFVDVAPAAGVDHENRYYPAFLSQPLAFEMLRFGPAGITAADYDGDGFHDLFIPDGADSRLYRNEGDGGFEDVTEAAGLAGLSGVSVALFADWDDDGDRDLFVSRTFEPNQLFENRGDGSFEDVTAGSGLAADCCTTVASFADYDVDGDLDLYVGRYLDPRLHVPTTFYARNGEPNRLYRNDGDGTFTDVTAAAGVGETGLCLGTAFGDYDDDGDPDLYVVNDFGRKTLYRNDGDGTFTDVTVATGTLAYGAGMSSSFGDYDNDGRLDLYVAHIRSDHAWFAEPPTVWRYMANSFRQGVWTTDMPLYFEIFRQSGFQFVDVFQQMASGNTLLRNRGDGTF
ncbi:MAG TPA: VCBS repeat-containing protein, partial [Thermoanaerobaculia bacterium]|nr:VCBS repeat-containing protein [Thermoanaerobaculia bacterium]